MLLETDLLAAAEGVRATGGQLVLSRALCRYRYFRAPAGLSARQIGNAARTFAHAHAPFAETASLLVRSGAGVGIWWWDAARIAAAFGGKSPRVVIPESLLRGSGEGWRVVACPEGFEAQYWEAGALVASTWRREAFTREQWAAFALSVETPAFDPPSAPPAPAEARLNRNANWRRNQIKAPRTWRDAELALATAALCAAALAAFFAGQALRYRSAAGADARATAAIEARINQDQNLQRVRERSALLQAYDRALGRADVLSATADAFAVLDQFGVQPRSWRIDQGELHATAFGAAGELPLRDIVAALEATPSLCDVEPFFHEGSVEFTAVLAGADNARCGSGA